MKASVDKPWAALLVSLLMGVVADQVLRATPWGLNAAAWLSLLVVAASLLCRWVGAALPRSALWWGAPALGFAGAIAWRDSATLKILDAVAVFVSASLMVWCAHRRPVVSLGVTRCALALGDAATHLAAGFLLLVFGDVKWRALLQRGGLTHGIPVFRGVLIAVPFLVLFGGLFVSADAAFSRLLGDLFDLHLSRWGSHLLGMVIGAAAAGGFIRVLVLRASQLRLAEANAPKPGGWEIETHVVLGLLNLLFLLFVAVQFRYFFGGATLVEVTPGMTYSEYARRGFFELVAVATLVLPLLLGADWLLQEASTRAQRLFRVLAGWLVLLLFVIMVSAGQRMRLYRLAYGLTELRLYTTVFMVWLAVVFVWFLLTVLRSHRERFAFGALIAGLLVLFALHVVNPDDFIVRTNLAHAQAGHGFDAEYAASLSADTVPALVAALTELSPGDQLSIAAAVRVWLLDGPVDWRTWSWARAAARRAAREKEGLVRTLAATE